MSFQDPRIAGAGPVREATVVEVDRMPPDLREAGSATWIARGATFVVAITRAEPGARLSACEPDESMVYVPPGMAADVAGRRVDEDALVIVPPGESEIRAHGAGFLYRIFTSRSSLAGDASPTVNGGGPLRVYPLKDVVSGERFGRIYRSPNLMVNVFEPYPGPRDQAQLSPHAHEAFDQGSLTIAGRFEHYLRTPWGPDRANWRPDRVVACGSPAITIIPARTVHTTAWLGPGRMIDVFSPPRADFASWVRNEEDYR